MAIICTIDFETMGLGPDAPLIEFGYCMGSTDTHSIFESGTIPISEVTNTQLGKVASFDTIAWWMGQCVTNPEAGNHIIGQLNRMKKETKVPIGQPAASSQFHEFLRSIITYDVTQLWCTDKNFDYLFLQQLLKHFGFILPLSYKEIFDCRHMRSRSHPDYFKSLSDTAVIHTGEDDAIALFDALGRIDQDYGVL